MFHINRSLLFALIVFRMEFDKTRWSCPWKSDQNCTQNSAKGVVGVKGVGGGRVGGGGGQGSRGGGNQGVGVVG